MTETPRTELRPRTIKAGRKQMTLTYDNGHGKHWVFEDYASGEFQIHGPFATKAEATATMVSIKENGGMFHSVPEPSVKPQ